MRRQRMNSKILASVLLCATSAVQAAPLTIRSNRLFIPVTINGVQAEALLDSAAEMTLVDPKLAARLKLVPEGSETAKGSGGTTQVQFASGVNIEAAGLKLANLTVAMLDMTDLSKRVVAKDLQIILGREFFDGELLALALIRQKQPCAFADESLGDGVGETPAIGDAQNQGSLALQKLGHEGSL